MEFLKFNQNCSLKDFQRHLFHSESENENCLGKSKLFKTLKTPQKNDIFDGCLWYRKSPLVFKLIFLYIFIGLTIIVLIHHYPLISKNLVTKISKTHDVRHPMSIGNDYPIPIMIYELLFQISP